MTRQYMSPLWAPEDEGKTESAPETKAGAVPEPKPDSASEAKGDPAPESKTADSAAPAPKADPTPEPKPDWRDRRIAALTAQLRNQAKPVAEAPKVADPKAPLDPTADFNSRVAELARVEAARLVATQAFTEACNAMNAKGIADYGKEEFQTSVIGLQTLAAGDQARQNAYFNLLQAAIDTGEGAKVIYELGQDLEEADRILGLSPIKMAVALTKKGFSEPVAEVSKAPKPITPVESRGGRHEATDPSDPEKADNLPTGEWMRRRQAQVDAQMKAARGA